MLQEVHMDVRVVKTRQFGELHVEPHHIFEFAEGLFGFDDLHEFVLIADEQSAPLNWLISLEQPEIGFPVLSPKYIDPAYSPGKEYANDDRFAFYVIVTLSQSGMSVNMKAPVILDCSNLTGKQIILSSDRYQPNHPLGKQSRA
jgi:flagellar assembly factor FliW